MHDPLRPIDTNPTLAHLLGRRDLLRVGSVSLAGALLPPSIQSLRAESVPLSRTVDSVIFLWMGGGVTHIDSFDPKPQAPSEIRGTLDTIQTTLPGVIFGEPMPRLARIAHELCLVRSFSHDSNDHLLSQVYTLSGRKVDMNHLYSEPNLGSLVSYLLGSRNGLPGYIAVPGTTRPGPPPYNFFVGGWLGPAHAPFCVGGQPEQPDFTVGPKLPNPSPFFEEDLNPKELTPLPELTLARLGRRADLRSSLELAQRTAENLAPGQAEDFQRALRLLTAGEIRAAFDITSESPATRDHYGRTKIGGRCLMARKLVEAGARFVMVDYGYDHHYGNLWDIHNAPGQNFPHVSEMCKRGYHLAGIDQAFAALISDLKDRGLLSRTLVVYLTEFGRTPKINADGGRDHWGMAGSIFFTGGSVRTGQVIGATDATAAWPTTQPWSPADLAATILSALGIDTHSRIPDRQNRPVAVLDTGRLIEGVLA